ncbi:hypothetical protein GDO81_010511 [Engystomops pustulosus]|uniref:Uncharacterized protein n=1 Tax=Engystomops pustulosus TaxID=76066 RepID=A0AAV7C1I6_ENGPU|nr:hypothetical protein GDO81_010511 [Engystomops pustulosus]
MTGPPVTAALALEHEELKACLSPSSGDGRAGAFPGPHPTSLASLRPPPSARLPFTLSPPPPPVLPLPAPTTTLPTTQNSSEPPAALQSP